MNISSIAMQPLALTPQNNTAPATEPVRISAEAQPVTASPATEKQKTQPVDSKQLEAAVKQVQDFTHTLANELKFKIDEDSGRTVVKIVDSSTDEVIRQIPSEEMLVIAKALDKIQGLLIKQKA